MELDITKTPWGAEISQELSKEEKAKRNVDLAMNLARRTGFLAAARAFIEDQPVYYDRNRLWWLWNKTNTRWEITDETEILTVITECLKLFGDASVKSRNQLVEALKQEGRKNRPKDFPKTWIQFKDRVYDLDTGNTYPATSEYFCTNPIPWKIGDNEDTPTISKLFDDWVGPEYTPTLYEILAYHCYADYPIHVLFCLVGNGRNGKSKFQGLIQRFIGTDNLCSTELENIFENRFETFKLYRKLGCLMGETNFNTIRNTSLLKKLVGQDLIGFEAKNKDPFDDYNYAKIVISSNSLPTSEDSSDGFYRRWIIINFPHEFPEGKDILSTIPPEEYENLARRITKILPELLRLGKFQNQGTIEERKQRYIEASNPLMLFIKDHCVEAFDATVPYSTLYTQYVSWLNSKKRRVVSRKEFSETLEREGKEIKKTTIAGEMGRFVFGIKLKDRIPDFVASSPSVPHVPDMPVVTTSPSYACSELEQEHIGHIAEPAPISPSAPQEIRIASGTDIIAYLRSKHPEPVAYEDLLAALAIAHPEPDRWLSVRLEAMAQNGDIYSPKHGHYQVLE